MARNIDSATATALDQQLIYGIWLIRLDIVGDTVYINTGLTNLTFGSGSGYDPALVGNTFIGTGNIGAIDPIVDSSDGSQGLNLTLPGISLFDDYFHQIITNGDLWQRQPAYVFFALTDNTGALLGKPIRVKSARIDQLTMNIDPDNNTGTIILSLESQANYNSETNQTRYNQQSQFDATDISQAWIYALNNMVADIAVQNSGAQTKAAAAAIIAGQTPKYF